MVKNINNFACVAQGAALKRDKKELYFTFSLQTYTTVVESFVK